MTAVEAAKWISAAILALALLVGGAIRAHQFKHRRRWISAAAGASVAYVFVHLLPELSEQQAIVAEAAGRGVFLSEVHVYIAVLVGFVLFFGLDTMAVASRTDTHSVDQTHRADNLAFWIHLPAMALNVGLIGYLLVDWNRTLHSLVFYTLAMAFHFLVYDHTLRNEYGGLYDKPGRWILSASVAVGFAVGVALALPESMVGISLGFVSGGVTINGIRDELPSAGEGRFVPFALGAAVYSALLLL